VLSTLESVIVPVFEKFGKYSRVAQAPFRHIPYNEAMERYGSDKPDLRIDLEIQDVTETVAGCGFGPFENATVKAVVVHDFNQARKWIDKLLSDVEVQTGNKVCWVKVDENGNLAGGISKFLAERQEAFKEALGLKAGSFVCMAAGKKLAAQKTAGVVRTMLGKRVPGHFDEEQYAMCWIVDFPMYEMGEESGQLEFCHNPFSMPQGGMQALLDAEGDNEKLLAINADQYDLVINGYESASGAVRNHDPEIMVKAFQMVGLGEEDVKAKFPAMYNAFTYGAPPHAGAAPGVDRLVMLLTGEESIREVITFPMNKNAQDLMMDAPTTVSQKQLDDVHILINEAHLQ
jgi:aspartyl-tRNA synthetase